MLVWMGHPANGSRGDSTTLCRANLQRTLFFQYAQQINPNLHEVVAVYGTWKRQNSMYGMDKDETVGAQAESNYDNATCLI